MTVPTETSVSTAVFRDRHEWLLFRGIRGLLNCDGSETVEAIARYVMSQYWILGVMSGFMERRRHTSVPARAAFLGAVTRYLEVRAGKARTGSVWVARLENERRVLENVPQTLPQVDWSEWRFRRRPAIEGLSAVLRQLVPNRGRIIRLARLLLRRRLEFFRVLRAIEMIGYYARFKLLFQKGNYSLAVMSSHSNPHGIAFNIAARRSGVPVVLITHGMPVRPVAKLDYDIAVVHCQAAQQIYVEGGCRIDRTFIQGRRQQYAEMPDNLCSPLCIGIFLCKDVNEAVLQKLTGDLLHDPNVSRIVIRSHNKNLWLGLKKWINSFNDQRVSLSKNNALQDDIAISDIVLGGNSSVLIEAVTAGRPAGYVSGLDHGSPDLHEFLARGLIYPFRDGGELDPNEMLSFYQRAGWRTVLRHFSNIDDDDGTVLEQVAMAMGHLAERQR